MNVPGYDTIACELLGWAVHFAIWVSRPAHRSRAAGRVRPTDRGELVQVYDDRDVFHASPDELPAVDIHSLW